jgi:hypothetical protein
MRNSEAEISDAPGIVSIDRNWSTLWELFKEAEDALHEAELIHGDLSVPSINQLRYAGHHILLSLVGGDQAPEEEIRRAERHCQRAIYDAYDSAVVYLLARTEQFMNDYREIPILEHFPKYDAVRTKARESRDLIISAKKDFSEREKYYAACRDAAKQLKHCIELMEDARDELNKAISRRNKSAIFTWVMIGITSLGVAVASSAAYFSYLAIPVEKEGATQTPSAVVRSVK